MRRLVVHAGTYKTGTSKIQNLAWQHREALLAQGWLYPESGLLVEEPEVGVRHAHLVFTHREPATWNALVDQLIAEIAASPAEQVLLSSEGWSRPGYADSLTDLVGRLREAAVIGTAQDDVHTVVYVRNRFEYARAFYREFTRRRGNRLDFADFIDANRRPLDLLESVATLYDAPGRLTVVPYAGAGDVAAHFFGLLGLDLPPSAQERVNTGIGAVDTEALRQVNLIAPDRIETWPLGRPDEGHAEVPRADQLTADEQWRTEFARISGWSAEDLEALTRFPDPPAHDVLELVGALHGEVLAWRGTAQIAVETYPHEAVQKFSVRPVEDADKPWITGFLLLQPGESGWRLVGVDAYREREIGVDRPSPAFAAKHPQRPEAAHARWGTTYLEFGLHGRIDLHLVHEDGRRGLLATLTRRYTG